MGTYNLREGIFGGGQGLISGGWLISGGGWGQGVITGGGVWLIPRML